MNSEKYRVSRIEGEYAYIVRESDGEELFIAMALLPPDIDVGTELLCEGFEFSVI